MSREPYDKPEVRLLEINDLLDEASRLLHSACNQLEAAKVESDRIRPVILEIEAAVAQAMLELDQAKNIQAKVDAVIDLRRRAHEA